MAFPYRFSSALTLDIPYARKVLEHLIAHPEEHNQGHFGYRTPCGTTACIAGTAVLFDAATKVGWTDLSRPGNSSLFTIVLVDNGLMDLNCRAAELLGLSEEDANVLFYDFNARSALQRLTHYIAEAEKAQAC